MKGVLAIAGSPQKFVYPRPRRNLPSLSAVVFTKYPRRGRGVAATRVHKDRRGTTDRPRRYQGVHMIFDGEFDAPWVPGEAKTNKLVFIGKNLDKGQLEREFSACLDSPANRAAINAVEQIKAMERQQSALLGAAQRDDVKALKGIIGSGVDVSAGNAVGQTARRPGGSPHRL